MFMIYLVLIFLKYYSYTCIICWLSVNLEHQVPSSIRLPRKQGGNATKATDMLKAILNPVVSCQYNDRYEQVTLPPVDAPHCDVSAILSELQALRAEVRASSDLREEVCNLARELTQVREEVSQLRRQPSCSKDEVSAQSYFVPRCFG